MVNAPRSETPLSDFKATTFTKQDIALGNAHIDELQLSVAMRGIVSAAKFALIQPSTYIARKADMHSVVEYVCVCARVCVCVCVCV
jgi:hypothetical protein